MTNACWRPCRAPPIGKPRTAPRRPASPGTSGHGRFRLPIRRPGSARRRVPARSPSSPRMRGNDEGADRALLRELAADLAALVRGGVDVDVALAALQVGD